MEISLSPQRRDDTLTVEKNGDVLTINGEPFDFGPLPEGATIQHGEIPCDWICGDVERINGDLHLCLILPHGAEPAEYVAFPAPIANPPDGVLDLPFSPYSTTTQEPAQGGVNLITTRYEWQADPVSTIEFIADPPPELEQEQEDQPEELIDVEA